MFDWFTIPKKVYKKINPFAAQFLFFYAISSFKWMRNNIFMKMSISQIELFD